MSAPLVVAIPSANPTAIIYLFLHVSASGRGWRSSRRNDRWIPSLGIEAAFRLDGLSLIFALLFTGIGCVVFLYASLYLRGHARLVRFYIMLTLFMASMLGAVLADDLVLLVVFWELTSITSFLLIG